ncbi:MAG TPA: C-terminal binding protein [Jiangellaceae bacterium]|nr:C-terminal binding protein [Jiangellaceae bacterium]
MNSRIVITDCDHDSIAPEQEVADQYGIDLVYSRSATTEDVIANAEGADGIVVQYATINAEVLDALPQLKAIGRYGVGVDTVDVDAATSRGVAVSNVPDYGTEAVSDHAIALTLTLARGIARLDRGIRAGSTDFVPVKPLYVIGGRTFGIIGLGLIGSATARKARGLGYHVIAHDIRYQPGTEVEGVEIVTLTEVLSHSDVVSLHTPLTAQTVHLIGAAELATMRRDAILVNTSRGGVVDTDALASALARGGIRGAGLDVHEDEPISPDHPLTAVEDVVLTPHTAWYTEESYFELKRRTIENVAQVVTGIRPRDILNPEVLGTVG